MRKKWVVTMSHDPWSDIQIPASTASLNTRRVEAEGKWDFFWARSVDRRCLLVLFHTAKATPKRRLPLLRGLELQVVKTNSVDKRMLVFRLLDNAHRDIFHQLCRDIVSGTQGTMTEKEAVDLALVRTWRWHHLLRSRKGGVLSLEQQRGLIGELLVLENYLLPNLTALDAVAAWQGPLGATKDFELGRLCIEAKTRRGATVPHIVISSEHQLDSEGIDELFLYVAELDSISGDTGNGFSLTELVSRIRATVAEAESEVLEAFEIRLAAVGFRWEDDYSRPLWAVGKSHLYLVTDKFPRIVSWGLKSGITNVKYSIALAECESFKCPSERLIQTLSETVHG